jgi:hypothetical protein
MKLHKLLNTTIKNDYLIIECSNNKKFALKKDDVVELDFVNYISNSNDKGKWPEIIEKAENKTFRGMAFFLEWIFLPLFLFIGMILFRKSWVLNETFLLLFCLFVAYGSFFIVYFLLTLVFEVFSLSTYEEKKTIGENKHILQVLDSKNNQYFFELPEYKNDCFFDILDFFNYKIYSVNSKEIQIVPKNNDNPQKLNYSFEFNFKYNPYGILNTYRRAFGIFYYFFIFLFFYIESYVLVNPLFKFFPLFIVLIPLIISLLNLILLVRSIYKKIKRGTFIDRTYSRDFLGLQDHQDNALTIEYTNEYLKVDHQNLEKDKVNLYFRNHRNRYNYINFEGKIEIVNSLFLNIITNDLKFEIWWKENFGKELNVEERDGNKIYKLNEKFYDKFGIRRYSEDINLNNSLLSIISEYPKRN